MVTSSRLVVRLAGALLLGTVLAPPAAASTITLTGGDAGEGYAPLASTFAAVNLGEAAAFVVQGVNFAASDPNIALSSVSTSFQNVASLGASANDVDLLSVVRSSVVNSGPITVTISGLTVGTSYQLDFFLAYQGAGRTQLFSSVGLSTVGDSVVYPTIGVPGPTIDVRQTLLPSLTGTIVTTISITDPAPDFGSILNALSVTSAPIGVPAIPEPGSMLLTGTGILALVRRRSRKFTARRCRLSPTSPTATRP